MKIIINGASGFIGKNLAKIFAELNYQVLPISRNDINAPLDKLINKIDKADIIINLAGASIMRRWTLKNKRQIYYSRIESTQKLCSAISFLTKKPQLFISASAVGIYGGEGMHSETSSNFNFDFLGKVCKDWENEAMNAVQYTKVVIFRFGIILGKNGGSFGKMVLPFKFFLGGKIASGKQGFSWIHLDDVLNAFLFVIKNQKNYGIINLCAPNPISNKDFTKEISAAIGRPAIFTIPDYLLNLVYGKAASLFTKGQFVLPEKLLSFGFEFKFPEIKQALKDLLHKK